MKYFNLFATAPNQLLCFGMVYSGRFFVCLLALVFSSGPLLAANPDEDRTFAVALDKFNIAPGVAEQDFAVFVQKYPNSVRVPEAILYQARARILSAQSAGAIDLLSTNQNRAGTLAPQYLFYLGTAYENKDDARAAGIFEQVWRKYPDSPKALEATIREAGGLARLKKWPGVIQLLQQTNSPFQQAIKQGAKSETMASGFLQLGEARLAQGDLGGIDADLGALIKQPLSRDLEWQRNYLICRRQRAAGELEDARENSADLLGTVNITNRSIGFDFLAGVLEQMTNLDAAVAAYTNNLASGVPAALQQRAVLKISELDLKQNRLPDVVQKLSSFLERFPESPAADRALLALGEVRLKQALFSADTNLTDGETNLFDKALVQFGSLISKFTNSPSLGKAYLDSGWCLSYKGTNAATNHLQFQMNSQAAFSNAVVFLPYSEEQAEARFKWADTQLESGDFAGAITDYDYIVKNYASLREANMHHLIERALYQSMRAALDETNLAIATTAVKRILTFFPDSFLGPSALLLAGQQLGDRTNAAEAREWFARFEQMYPTNPLLPELRLAIARSYEKEGNWEEAITNYITWLGDFPTNESMPGAKFDLARANDMAGHQTNALILFTNFIAQFPTNEMAARAQYWLGDFYFRQGDWLNAEYNYQLVFNNTNWTGRWAGSSDLTNLMPEARMMAGQAAVSRSNYKDAIGYFTNLLNSVCPQDLRVEATVAYADATVSRLDDPTNKWADLNEAIQSLATITDNGPHTWQAAQASGKIGDCYFQLGSRYPDHYFDASNAYRSVLENPAALSDAKNEARFALGMVAEKQAALKSGADQTALLKQAFSLYLDAFYQGLHDPTKPSPFWTEKSGKAAGDLAESLQDWPAVKRIYEELKNLLPVLGPICDTKIEKAVEHGALP